MVMAPDVIVARLRSIDATYIGTPSSSSICPIKDRRAVWHKPRDPPPRTCQSGPMCMSPDLSNCDEGSSDLLTHCLPAAILCEGASLNRVLGRRTSSTMVSLLLRMLSQRTVLFRSLKKVCHV